MSTPPLTEIRIRKAYDEDLERAAEVMRTSFLEFVAPGIKSQTAIDSVLRYAMADALRNVLLIPSHTLYVALRSDDVVGMAMYCARRREIRLLYVKSGHQRQGIGTRMLDRIIADHTHNHSGDGTSDGDAFSLILASSLNAEAAYQRWGFRRTGPPEQNCSGLPYVPMEMKVDEFSHS